jgi:hypothetical protein
MSMTQLPDPAPMSDPAADMFEQLRREVSLVRAAIEGLTAAREKMPDYSVSLGRIAEAQRQLGVRLEAVATSPALSITPEALVREYHGASQAARAEDRRLITNARDEMNRALGQLDAMIKRGQAVDRVRRNYAYFAGSGAVAGMLIWNVAALAISHILA